MSNDKLSACREKRTLKVDRALTRRTVSTETQSMSDPDARFPAAARWR
ncbi:MAG: hypothetical protein M3461_07400 [Pseudomonadota bacterium]|nr:hypothetical protein [Pseudomonadota bacterium]